MTPQIAILLLALLVASQACSPSGDPERTSRTAERDTVNWTLYGRTNDEQRFSPLAQINEQTVSRLRLRWSATIGEADLMESTPIVVDGRMYVTGRWSQLYALDAKTGAELWNYDPAVPRQRVARYLCCGPVSRGAAYDAGRIFLATLDGRLIAVDAATGRPMWATQTVDTLMPYSITGAPRIAGGLVIIGNGGADHGARGFVSAYHAASGHMAWRTFTVPGNPSLGFETHALQRAATTWKGEWWKGGGGGTAWDAIVYDPALGLVYLGVGNGGPWYRDLRSPGGGDNLYLASILALRASTGDVVWYFQSIPGDNWDYGAAQSIMLTDLSIGGELRRVILQASKNGFFYVIDRVTGAFISGTPFAKQTWALALDSVTGRPIESPALDGPQPVFVSPSNDGAHSWHPMAFHPGTGLVYFSVQDGTLQRHVRGLDPPPLQEVLTKVDFSLTAWNPVQRQPAWRVKLQTLEPGGVLATNGNLVLSPQGTTLVAFRATDGQELWRYELEDEAEAPPISYAVDGTQFIAIVTFGRVFAFTLSDPH